MERTCQFFHEPLSFYEAINRRAGPRRLRFLQGDRRALSEHPHTPERGHGWGQTPASVHSSRVLSIDLYGKHVLHSQHDLMDS